MSAVGNVVLSSPMRQTVVRPPFLLFSNEVLSVAISRLINETITQVKNGGIVVLARLALSPCAKTQLHAVVRTYPVFFKKRSLAIYSLSNH